MVEKEKTTCWGNIEEMENWAPGCGSGFKGKKYYSAEINGGWCEDITAYLFPRPGAVDPHCIYEVTSAPRTDGRYGSTYGIRCLFHGAKNAPPSKKIVAAAKDIKTHRQRLYRAKAAGIFSLTLVLIGLAMWCIRYVRRRWSGTSVALHGAEGTVAKKGGRTTVLGQGWEKAAQNLRWAARHVHDSIAVPEWLAAKVQNSGS